MQFIHRIIALVGRDGVDREGVQLLSRGLIDILLRFQNARGHFLVIGLISSMHLRLHDCPRVQVHHRLGLVNHVGRPVLSPADLGVRIVRVHPFLVAAFARPVAIKLAHCRRVIWINPALRRQPFHIIPVLLLGIAVNQRAQRGVSLDHRRINPQVLAAQQPMLPQRPQREREDAFIDFQTQPLANHREAGMLGGLLIELVLKKSPDRHRVGTACRNGAFARQVFKKADHNHLEVNHRINARPAHSARIIGRSTQSADLRCKAKAFQSFLQLGVEPTLNRANHFSGGDPELGLRCLLLRGEHNSQTTWSSICSF